RREISAVSCAHLIWRLGFRQQAGLAQRLVKRDRSGHCDVERSIARLQGNHDPGKDPRMDKIGDTGALAPEEQRVATEEGKAIENAQYAGAAAVLCGSLSHSSALFTV